MTGRLLLVGRLLVRDLRRRPTETLLLVLAIAAATATLTLGLALNELAGRPFQQTRAVTAGPDLVVEPGLTGPDAAAALAPLTSLPGVTGHSGPYPLAFLSLTTSDTTLRAVVEGRDAAPAAVDQPAVTDGTWVRPGRVVVERAFADAAGIRTGDTVGVGGHRLRVAGIAVTTARTAFPRAGWHEPDSIVTEGSGLVWVDRADIAGLVSLQQVSYVLNLRLADPGAGIAAVDPGRAAPGGRKDPRFRGWFFRTGAEIAATNGRLTAQARDALLIGSWLLTVLAVLGVAGIVAGRVVAQRRRVGLLKAVGAGPAMIAAVHLAEYLLIGIAAAGAGLVAGWLAAPPLFRQTAGLIGVVGVHPPPLRTVAAGLGLALAIAAAAGLVPVLRAVTTGTTTALSDTAAPPRRRRWRVAVSRRLPTALLIGVRVNARRPYRARLVTLNTLVTTTVLAVVLTGLAQDHRPVDFGAADLPDAQDGPTLRALLLVAGMVCLLALLNTAVSTWTGVIDARHPLAVARALGATPTQAAMGLAAAQLLPAVPGVAAGILLGAGLFAGGDNRAAPALWMAGLAAGVLLCVTALTAWPALTAARHPVADTLRGTAT